MPTNKDIWLNRIAYVVAYRRYRDAVMEYLEAMEARGAGIPASEVATLRQVLQQADEEVSRVMEYLLEKYRVA